eukprot:Opistho-2@62801
MPMDVSDLPFKVPNIEEISLEATGAHSNEAALQYLESFGRQCEDGVLFTDNMLVNTESERVAGESTVAVEKAVYRGEECYGIISHSQARLSEEASVGLSLTAYISFNLETLRQECHQFVKINDRLQEKRSFVAIEDNFLVVAASEVDGSLNIAKYDRSAVKGFISEGADRVLQRLLALDGRAVQSPLEFVTLNADNSLAKATYESLPPKEELIGEETYCVLGIERRVVPAVVNEQSGAAESEESHLRTDWHSYYMPDGHCAARIQLGAPVFAVIRPPSPVTYASRVSTASKPVVPSEDAFWETDMELMSDFIQKKDQLRRDHQTYIEQHPELTALLSDFMSVLLQRTPDNVYEFAAEFFGPFSTSATTHT